MRSNTNGVFGVYVGQEGGSRVGKKVGRKLINRLEDNKRNNKIMEITSRKQKPKMGIFVVLFLKV